MKKTSLIGVVVICAFALLLELWHQTSAMPRRPLRSEIALDTGNGFGSTGVFARRFMNVNYANGSAISYVASATDGDSFRINDDGVYSISLTEFSTNGDTFSISLNSNPAVEITGLLAENRLCSASVPVGHLQNCAVTLTLSAGDVIRAHRSTGAIGAVDSSAFVRFIITRVDR